MIVSVQEDQAHFRELRELIKAYDSDKSGSLNAQELTKCIQVYSALRQWTIGPVTPTEDEISMLLKAASHHMQNSVDVSEIEVALELWHSYVTNRAMIETIFEKYDTDHNQKLEYDQLVRYLTDLNGGRKPEVKYGETAHFSCPNSFSESVLSQDADVRALLTEMNSSDGLNKVQLTLATSRWRDAHLLVLIHIIPTIRKHTVALRTRRLTLPSPPRPAGTRASASSSWP
jgi:Ca2+-binding EF-hand superfamily protein